MVDIKIQIDRKTGRVIGADMPPADLDTKALWDRELKPDTLFLKFVDCLGGGEIEQERMREYGRRSNFMPAVQELHTEYDPMREPPAGQ